MRFTLYGISVPSLICLMAGVVSCGEDTYSADPMKSCKKAMPVAARSLDAEFSKRLANTQSTVTVSVGHSVNACTLALQKMPATCRGAFSGYAECLEESFSDAEGACASQKNAVDQNCASGLEGFLSEVVKLSVPQPREGGDIRNVIPVRVMKLGEVEDEMPRLLRDDDYRR